MLRRCSYKVVYTELVIQEMSACQEKSPERSTDLNKFIGLVVQGVLRLRILCFRIACAHLMIDTGGSPGAGPSACTGLALASQNAEVDRFSGGGFNRFAESAGPWTLTQRLHLGSLLQPFFVSCVFSGVLRLLQGLSGSCLGVVGVLWSLLWDLVGPSWSGASGGKVGEGWGREFGWLLALQHASICQSSQHSLFVHS